MDITAIRREALGPDKGTNSTRRRGEVPSSKIQRRGNGIIERDKKNCDVLVFSLVFSKTQLRGRARTSKVLGREARHIRGR